MTNLLPAPLRRVLEDLERLPGIGQKSAQRIAFFMLRQPPELLQKIGEHVASLRDTVRQCGTCGMLTEQDPCRICSDTQRNKGILCIVETPLDVLAIERTGEYQGIYHVLGGTLSPLDHIGPEDINIASIPQRIKDQEIKEVILALNPSTEGEATTLYLSKMLQNTPVSVSRIAQGLPTGAALEYADDLTIVRALSGRHEL